MCEVCELESFRPYSQLGFFSSWHRTHNDINVFGSAAMYYAHLLIREELVREFPLYSTFEQILHLLP